MVNNFKSVSIFLILFSLIFSHSLYSQSIKVYPTLDKSFKDYDIMNIDSRSVYQAVSTSRNGSEIKLRINEKTEWNLYLENSEIISPNYLVSEGTADGIVRKKGTTALPMQGYVVGQPNSRVSLTFNDNFIYGFIKIGQSTYFIEPLSHFEKSESADKFVMYSVNDIIQGEEKVCGYDQYLKGKEENKHHVPNTGSARNGLCFRIEIALAADYSMFQQYGNSTGVQNHNIGVLNNVQTNYDDEFADELQFVLTEQWLSTCSTCDPWTSSTDPYNLLDDFTPWGTSGFSASHDVASLWSNRNFDGGTIGLAWVGAACTSNKYNVLEDFSSNAEQKRVLQAHELGHNFDASHNTGIMAPSVSSSTVWSSTSISEIENFYMSLSCLDNCPSTNAPTADFIYQVTNPCNPAEVQFTNLSTNSTSWFWTFDGGTPATSTDENPIVTFTDSGLHDVTLQAFNGSNSNSITIPVAVNVIYEPVADFVYNIDGLLVSFIYNGTGATSYLWDFGDGTSTSNAQNPTHTYAVNGVYNVSLTVNNQCGSHQVIYPVEINALPFVNFTSNVTSGCQPQSITFSNLSSNATSYIWSFPGGTPATSTLDNPVVVYNTPGIYTVTLEAINNAGSNSIVKTDYINISASATAGFTYNATGALVTFTNTGQNGNTFNWNFGDGNSSTVGSPSHQYTNNGSYTVVQTVTNGCGSVQSTQVITIALAPVTSFSSSYTGPICAGQSVSFTNTSTFSPTSYLWTFEGGNPATSTDPNPTVIYPSGGTFDVTFATTNSFGTTQSVLQNYVVVNDKPIISFSAIGDGLEVDFTQAIQFGTGHLWNFGDGQTSTAINPTHTYNAEGTYVVTLSDSNTCGTTTNSQNLLVQLLPTAGFSTTSTSVCIGNQVQFNNQSSQSVTAWNWTFEGGNPATSTLENPVVTYSQTGTYNVSLTVTNASGQNTTTIIDYMHVITVPSTEFDGIISGNTLTLDNTSISVASSHWNIFTDNINASLNGDHVIYTALQNGTYNVILTNTNQCGQSISDTVQYIINAYPFASYALNNGNPTCSNQNVQFFAADGVGNTYNWAFTGGQPSTSNEQNPVILYNNAGTYTVRLIVSNIYGADTLDSNVNIGALPIAAFTSVINNNQAQFTMTGNGHTSQTWNFGDGSNSSDLNPTHVYSASGNYTITLITSNGCGNDTIVQTVAIIISATDNYNDKVVFNLVPNPASDFINMEFDGFKTGEFKIAVTDLSGRKLIDQTLFLSGKQVQNMEISNLPAGAYFVKLTGTDIFKTKKLVVVR